jgi:hypothetical protein
MKTKETSMEGIADMNLVRLSMQKSRSGSTESPESLSENRHSPAIRGRQLNGTGTNYRASMDPVPTADNLFREPMLWSKEIEDVLLKWNARCLSNVHVHATNGLRYMRIYILFAIPASVIPLSLASLSAVMDPNHLLFLLGMVISGALSTVVGVINPGGHAQLHRSFEQQYSELATEITKELVKPQRYRTEADVFLQRVLDRYNYLNNLAPDN